MNMKDVKIAYIGGGSRLWARTFMGDISVQDKFCGEVRLYDIDRKSAEDNMLVGRKYSADANAKSKWSYAVAKSLEQALSGVDFVMISILPGTFDEMESDVHTPEKFGVYQSVGDTAGPGGIIRAMRAIPMFEELANAIKAYCPNAWVINFTNPMTYCTKALFDVFPKIKAIGCCHEVFGTQAFLIKVLKDILNIDAERRDIKVDVLGVNHFTWITDAKYNGIDLFPVLDEYLKKHGMQRRGENICKNDSQLTIEDKIAETHEFVKCDLYRRYGQLAAAGDRHLAEFVNNTWYLKSLETVYEWGFGLTPVSWRKQNLINKVEITKRIIKGEEQISVKQSKEEFTMLMSAILGQQDFISNVNLPNTGQMPCAPMCAVVETNAVFSKDSVKPLCGAVPLNNQVEALVLRIITQQENVYSAVKERNLNKLYNCFAQDPLCSSLSLNQSRQLFDEMVNNTKKFLPDW